MNCNILQTMNRHKKNFQKFPRKQKHDEKIYFFTKTKILQNKETNNFENQNFIEKPLKCIFLKLLSKYFFVCFNYRQSCQMKLM